MPLGGEKRWPVRWCGRLPVAGRLPGCLRCCVGPRPSSWRRPRSREEGLAVGVAPVAAAGWPTGAGLARPRRCVRGGALGSGRGGRSCRVGSHGRFLAWAGRRLDGCGSSVSGCSGRTARGGRFVSIAGGRAVSGGVGAPPHAGLCAIGPLGRHRWPLQPGGGLCPLGPRGSSGAVARVACASGGPRPAP